MPKVIWYVYIVKLLVYCKIPSNAATCSNTSWYEFHRLPKDLWRNTESMLVSTAVHSSQIFALEGCYIRIELFTMSIKCTIGIVLGENGVGNHWYIPRVLSAKRRQDDKAHYSVGRTHSCWIQRVHEWVKIVNTTYRSNGQWRVQTD